MHSYDLRHYDPTQSYDWNYEHAPDPPEIDEAVVDGDWRFCGLPVASPLGVAAGPLLNGRWLRYYAALGFDVLTYKTVRSVQRACYPMPNLVSVAVDAMTGGERQVRASASMRGTWAVSFGMPSKPPEVWRADVEATRRLLPKGKVLVVSVVATEQPGWTIDDLADDYARCARWAVESGADAIEANFSCPNVCTSDGQLYQHPREAAVCAARLNEAVVGNIPVIIKVGHMLNNDEAEAIVDALSPHVTALAMTNSVAAPVIDETGKLLFDGAPRGICGAAILDASVAQTRMVSQIVARRFAAYYATLKSQLMAGNTNDVASTTSPSWIERIGVGGAFTADDVRRYLVAGASSVHLATAAMIDPTIALKIRRTWSEPGA